MYRAVLCKYDGCYGGGTYAEGAWTSRADHTGSPGDHRQLRACLEGTGGGKGGDPRCHAEGRTSLRGGCGIDVGIRRMGMCFNCMVHSHLL